MNKLNADELDLLARVVSKPALEPFFFRRVKSLRWFDALEASGFFEPQHNPRPTPADNEGFFSVPYWPATEYLVACSSELTDARNIQYAQKLLTIIRRVTRFAEENGFSNYRTWWQFSKLINNVPANALDAADLQLVDFWLDDPFDRTLVAAELGVHFLPNLLANTDVHSHGLAMELLNVLYKVEQADGRLRVDGWHIAQITKKIAFDVGERLQIDGIKLFERRLTSFILPRGNDRWSSVWRPAIEPHKQNHATDSARDTLLDAFRDSLSGWTRSAPVEAEAYLQVLLGSDLQTMRRVSIYVISKYFDKLNPNAILPLLLKIEHLRSNYRHEMWHFLEHNFVKLPESARRLALTLIQQHSELNDDGAIDHSASAYRKAIWLSAIAKSDANAAEQYKRVLGELGGVEPEHPDFSSYTTVGFVDHKSPVSTEALLALNVDELVCKLESYKDLGAETFFEPGIEGLSKAVKLAIKSSPIKYYRELIQFSELDYAYLYVIIEAYHELWREKANLPWNAVWPCLLAFASALISKEKFWAQGDTAPQKAFVANRNWVVGALARLIEAGTRDDAYSFDSSHLLDAERLLIQLLNRQEGERFTAECDAVSVAINSPRGQCIEALINLTLRQCRLQDKALTHHADAWNRLEGIYDAELLRRVNDQCEFVTLAANYLPNFLYMSSEWTLRQLPRIFDKNDHLRWLCSIQGYGHVNMVYEEVYVYLKTHGDLIKALDDFNVKTKLQEKIVQNIAVAYLNDFEPLSGSESLLAKLIDRGNPEEVGQLIWFFWTQREDANENFKDKIFAVWRTILDKVDLTTKNGKAIASKLCKLSAFIDRLDEISRALLEPVVQYAQKDFHTAEVVRTVCRISVQDPMAAAWLWSLLLEHTTPDYPDDELKKALLNIANSSDEGMRQARRIVDKYIIKGSESGIKWLASEHTRGS